MTATHRHGRSVLILKYSGSQERFASHHLDCDFFLAIFDEESCVAKVGVPVFSAEIGYLGSGCEIEDVVSLLDIYSSDGGRAGSPLRSRDRTRYCPRYCT